MASLRLVTGSVITISSGGTAEALSDTSLPLSSLSIQAAPSNTGTIYIGDSSVTTSSGFGCLAAKDSTEISVESLFKTGEFDLKDIYVISATTGDKVRIAYFRKA